MLRTYCTEIVVIEIQSPTDEWQFIDIFAKGSTARLAKNVSLSNYSNELSYNNY